MEANKISCPRFDAAGNIFTARSIQVGCSSCLELVHQQGDRLVKGVLLRDIGQQRDSLRHDAIGSVPLIGGDRCRHDGVKATVHRQYITHASKPGVARDEVASSGDPEELFAEAWQGMFMGSLM